MTQKINMWTLHTWLNHHDVAHYYSIEEDHLCFEGIRLLSPDTDLKRYAVLSYESGISLYHVVLSFGRNKLYFRDLGLSEATDLLNRFMTEYKKWCRSMYQINLKKEEPRRLLDNAYRMIPFPMVIIRDSQIVTYGPEAEVFSDLLKNFPSRQTIPELLNNTLNKNINVDQIRLADFTYIPGARLLYLCFSSGNHIIWIMLLDRYQDLTPGDIQMVNILKQHVKYFFQCRDDRSRYHFSVVDYLMTFIRNKESSDDKTARLLRHFKWSFDDKYSVFLIEQKSIGINLIMNAVSAKLKTYLPSSFNMILNDRILLIINMTRAGDILQIDILKELTDSGEFIIGRSMTGGGFDTIPALVRQAFQAVEHCRKHDLSYMDAKDMSSAFIIRKINDNAAVQALIHPAVRRLVSIDQQGRHSFSTIETLRTLLLCGGNYNETSRRLHIHRNTLLNRLNQISDDCGISPESYNTQALLLSILLMK